MFVRWMALALLLLLFAPPAWGNVEARCTDLVLGGDCACSETYDTTSHTDDIGGQGNANADNSSAAEECDNTTGNWFPAIYMTPVAQTGMPPGNTVTTVWQHEAPLHCDGQFNAAVTGDGGMMADTKRICTRAYHKLSADWYDGEASGGKWIEMTWDGAHSMQYGHNGFGAGNFFSCRFIWDAPIANCAQSGPLLATDCLGEWCRVEMCIEGDFVGETGDFYLEGYWERVSDGKRRDVPRQLIGTSTSDIPEGIGFNFIGDLYRGCGDPGAACGDIGQGTCTFSGNRQLSHAMQAEWPFLQAGLFIGAASEIEGAQAPVSTGSGGSGFSLSGGSIR